MSLYDSISNAVGAKNFIFNKGASMAFLFATLSLTAYGADKDTVAIEKNLKLLYPKTKFHSIKTTPVAGIYEVVMGRNVAYVGDDGRYFIFGHLFDMETQTDLTEDVLQENVKIDFSTLPLQQAIKTVKGDGKRIVAIFSDPDCPYCKKLEQELAKINNVTIYTFLFPLGDLHPEAKEKADAIWCAKDKSAAWGNFMLSNKLPIKTPGCEAPTSLIADFANSHGIAGTPFLIKSDSKTMPGAADAAKLEKWLGGNAK